MSQAFLQAFVFLIDTLAGLFLLFVILRFLLQLSRADFFNPFSQAVVKITNPLLMPLRKIVPGFFGVDLACLLLALLVQLAFAAIMVGLFGIPAGGFAAIAVWAVIGIVLYILNLYFICIIILVIASFVAPMSAHPILLLVRQLCQPLLTPIQKIIPPMGGLDFSVLALSISIYVLSILLKGIAITVNFTPAFVLGSFFIV